MMIKSKRILLLFLLISVSVFSQKTYQKKKNSNGQLIAEGWMEDHQKTNYWKFYDANGNLKEEGHFLAGKKVKWWIFYDKVGKIVAKYQYKNNQKNGYGLLYKQSKLIKIVKYKHNQKLKEWTTLKDFKKENSLLDLQ